MPSFSKRSSAPEIMDDLQYAGGMMDQTLHELEVINRWLGGNAVTLGALAGLAKTVSPAVPLRIVDLGCGRGDMLRHIRHWAERSGIGVSLTGIDANPYIVNAARNNLRDLPDVQLHDINIFSQAFHALEFDIVIGTLFYHHFSDDELVSFFSMLRERCRIGFIINDIHRHPLAYYSIRILTAIFSRSDMVKYDAPLSVLRSFSRNDLVTILARAGLTDYAIHWRWAFRWQVSVRTS